ncbi:MAG: hypothetical protein Q8M11_10885 [Sulfuritalea sp.]|nr:hypothetical protein [Sulfuritalea sp.]MDP1985178.1 hypothetical protein [Sulfuritalea sp.]
MKRVLQLPRRAWRRALLEVDALAWRRMLSGLRAEARPASRGRVLVCDLFTMIGTAKVESLIAGCLSQEGLRATVLLPRREPILERLYRAACPDVEFAYFDKYLAAVQRGPVEAEAERLMEHAATTSDLAGIERAGVRIGRNALSKVLRIRREGRLDLADQGVRSLVLGTLADSIQAADAATKLVSEVKPARALFNERGYTPAGEVFDACLLSGCDSIQWFGAPRPDSLMYTRYRLENRAMHPMALSPATWAKLKSLPWTEKNDQAVIATIGANYRDGGWYNRQKLQDGKKRLSADEVRQLLSLDPARQTAVIFAHILYDATFFYGESLYDDYEQWLVETVRLAIANPRMNWIVKVHPVNVWRSQMDGAPLEQLEVQALTRAFGKLPDHVKIMPADTPINTASLFDVADVGLTVRGTIGMELPCLGIPVVTAGTGRYSGLGFTIDPGSREEYAQVLSALHLQPRLDSESRSLARRHYYGALTLRPLPMRSFLLDFNANTYGLRDLAQNTRTVPVSAWQPGADLRTLAAWIANDAVSDLLQDEPRALPENDR